jgi:hypothetical protein
MSTDPRDEDQPPPLLGSWRNIYSLLALELVATTAILYGLTKWLS